VLIRTQPMTAAHIALALRLKIVSRHGVGFDAVDADALKARGIPLAIVGDVNSRAVAEHTLMLMLTAARKVVAHDRAVREGHWNYRNQFDAVELDGKLLFIHGFGRIGRRVAELAKAFGMRVAAHDPFVNTAAMDEAGVQRVDDPRDAYTSADFITLHVPASPKGWLIAATELAMMKSTAILINAARGGLIDEVALDAALRSGALRGAALDVLVAEPPRPDHPLLGNPAVTITPHHAGLTQECAKRMAIAAVQNIIDCFDGRLDERLVVNR
jgi:D-3-phosphoglycerate dehydrogenase / 2-oxoglutarate reductase